MNANIKIACLAAALALVALPSSAQEAVKKGAVKTKDAVVKGTTGVSHAVTDGWITSRVHERFITDDLLKGSDISVDTEKHVVTLKGTVMSAAGRRKAASIALRTEGVHRVVNHLTIGPKKG
ncbi:MAG TPA: BON domain-containing protein [Vicinamibacterales bacterium]|jgi:osmotically-inducible protein OsmY|nr:BON domain-containing protein [Vicinamibacterales bacterium]